MNRTYALVWNPSLATWTVAHEHARRRGKGAGAVLAAALLLPTMALAADLPTGGTVIAGSGQIGTPNANQMVIDQASNKLAINWQSFDIAAGKKVTFNQPGTDSIALNRVLGADGSKIMGQLDANGRVFIINPNGVLFGQGAQVNVGGLVASTLDISDSDFAAGNYTFKGNGSNARVTNNGTITAADGGSIALLGGTVSNNGVIIANQGSVALAAGNAMTLDFAGDGLLNVQVDAAVVDALVENHQLIKADGGQVLLSANAGEALLKTVVNNTGVIEAQTLGEKDGKIVLLGSFDGGTVQVAGTLDASAAKGGNGGFIETSGANVKVADGTQVTTKADNGKTGTWLIDPTNFTVSAGSATLSASGIGATTLSGNLANTNVSLQTAATGSEAGDINVNAAVSWSANTSLILNAHRNININAAITATGTTAGLALNYGGTSGSSSATPASGSDYTIRAPITLSGAGSTLSVNGNAYTLIHSMADLEAINSSGLDGRYALGNDLNASGTTYTSALIGGYPNMFNGTFAGLGHTISGLTIDASGDYIGLFGFTYTSSVIRDIGLVGGSVKGRDSVGGLAGSNIGTISSAYSTGSVTGTGTGVGGLVGVNQGTIRNAYTTGNVQGRENVGGLAGTNYATIANTYTTGSVTGSGIYLGGLVGRSDTNVSNSFYAITDASGNAINDRGAYIGQGSSISKTWTELTNASTFSAWDQSIWSFPAADTSVAGLSVGLPYLTGITRSADIVRGTLFAGGFGTQASAYTLTTWQQLANINRVLGSGYYFSLSNNLDKNSIGYDALASSNANFGTGWNPLGPRGSSFTGTFDGQNHTIGDLNIKRTGVQAIGLFGQTDLGSVIRNIGLVNAKVEGGEFTGALVGTSGSTISNAYTTGSVKGTSQSGGLVGANNGDISAAYSTSSVTTTGSNAGGLVGGNYGLLINAYAAGNVTAASMSSDSLGGLVGVNFGVIANTYATGNVTGTYSTGGLVGTNSSTINNSYATGKVTGTDNPGALVATEYGTTTNSFFATTNASGAAINTGVNGVGTGTGSSTGVTGKTWLQLTQAATFVGWNIASVGGSSAIWRIYEGQTGPLLRSFLQSVTLSADTSSAGKAYDGTVASGTTTYTSDLGSNLDPTKLLGSLSYASNGKNAGTYKTSDGSLSLGGVFSGQLGYDISYASGTLQITPKALTVSGMTASNKTYDGNTGAVLSGGSLSGLVGSETLSAVSSGTFGDKNVGTGKTVTVSTTLSNGSNGGLAANYTVTAPTVTANITPKNLTVSGVTVSDKVYDATRSATLSGGTLTGLISGETLTLSSLSGTFDDKNVGTGKTVTVNGATLGNGTGLASNYTLTAPTGLSATITKASLSVSGITASGKTYDGTDTATLSGTASVTALESDEVSVSGTGSGTFDNKNAGENKNVTVTGYTLSGSDAGNYVVVQPVGLTATIDKANLVISGITVAGKTYDGNVSAALSGTASITPRSGDVLTLGGTGLATFSDKNAGSNKPVTISGYTLSGNDAGNYTLVQPAGLTASIAKAIISSISGIVVDDKVYDGTTSATFDSSGATFNGLIGSDSLTATASDAAFTDKNVGTHKTVDITGLSLGGDDAGNYTLDSTVATSSAAITPKALTLSGLAGVEKTYDGTTDASFTGGTLNGLVGTETVLFDDLTAAFADANAGIGKTVTVTGGTLSNGTNGGLASNYTLDTPDDLTATITPKALTVTGMTASNKVYDSTLAATLSGGTLNGLIGNETLGLSGGTGEFDDKNAGTDKAVTVSGVTLVDGTGLASNYTVSNPTDLTADISKADLSLAGLSATGKTYDGNDVATLSGVASVTALGLDSVTLSGSGVGTFADKNAGLGKSVTVSGYTLSGTDADNYTLVQPDGGLTADIAKAALTITATDASKVGGQTIALNGYTSNGLVSGDSISALSLSSAGAPSSAAAGTYAIVASDALGAALSNYDITYQDGALLVSAAPAEQPLISSGQPYIGALASNSQTTASDVTQQSKEPDAIRQNMLVTNPLDDRMNLQVINQGIRLPEGI